MSWWLTLCTQTVASLMVLVTRKGRRRFVLFLRAALSFPVYVIHLFADENRHPSIHP